MTAYWMSDLAPPEVAGFDAFHRNQLSCGKPSIHNRASKAHIGTDRRVLRVMVVNDEQDTGDALVRHVRRCGYAARVAFDGLDALEVAVAHDPDVVLLDMEMTLVDACQVARRLRRVLPSKDCLIVAVSRRADDGIRQRSVEAGIDVLLIKPVDLEVVETLLMLECARVNRSQTDNTAGLTTKGSSPFARQKPSADERNRVATTSRSLAWGRVLRADDNR